MNDAFFTNSPASANFPVHPVHGSWVNSASAVRPGNGATGYDRCRTRRQRDFGAFRGLRLSEVDAVAMRRLRPATLSEKVHECLLM
ncbi:MULTISPECIES: hypothetical protein [Bradyrhizobium]